MAKTYRTNETRNWFSIDQRLRAYGFRILARPKASPTLWEKDGKYFTVAEAVAYCDRKVKEVETQSA